MAGLKWPKLDANTSPKRASGGSVRSLPDQAISDIAYGSCIDEGYGVEFCPTAAHVRAARVEWVRRFPMDRPPWCDRPDPFYRREPEY